MEKQYQELTRRPSRARLMKELQAGEEPCTIKLEIFPSAVLLWVNADYYQFPSIDQAMGFFAGQLYNITCFPRNVENLSLTINSFNHD